MMKMIRSTNNTSVNGVMLIVDITSSLSSPVLTAMFTSRVRPL